MTNLYSVSWKDLYDYFRCPKIVAINAYKALNAMPTRPHTSYRIPEEAIESGFSGVSKTSAMTQIAEALPEINLNDYLKQAVSESLRGVEKIREALKEEYGEIKIIGRAEGHHPDLACTRRPHYIAFTSSREEPILIDMRNSLTKKDTDEFQAKVSNGIASSFGIYLVEERVEEDAPTLSPRVIQGDAETVLLYPRSGRCVIVKDKLNPDISLMKQVALAKQLGFRKMSPETDCGNQCVHRRSKIVLREGNAEPLRPLPLIFSEGLLDNHYDLDLHYQVNYGSKLLLHAKEAAFEGGTVKGLEVWKEWLLNVVGLNREAAEITMNFLVDYHDVRFNPWRPSAETLLRNLRDEVMPWRSFFKERLKGAAPAILGRAKSIYALPKESARFVSGALKRWS
nr:hypothetical protein [Candidatus Njordarchaeum guaymaensis]